MSCPYYGGATIALQSEEKRYANLQVQILDIYEPFTLSCVMRVGVKHPDGIRKPDMDDQQQELGFEVATLKLYDRRFSAQHRSDHAIDPWTESHESAYEACIGSGRAVEFAEELERGEFGDPDVWSTGECEVYLQVLCKDIFEVETSVYAALHDYQGKNIPRLYAPIAIDTAPSSIVPVEGSATPVGDGDLSPSRQEHTGEHKALLHIKGILLEYIPGVKFSQLSKDTVPESSWQDLVDQAIRTVHILGDHNILNKDVRSDNLLAVQDPESGYRHRAVMIDFGYCRIREDDESDFDWGRAKHREDEEGAVGVVMRRILRKHGFELKYKLSNRYLQYAETEEESKEAERIRPLGEWLKGFASYTE